MPGKTQAEARLTQYLLGRGSAKERERLEAEYFAEEDAFAKMLSAEDDLIDAYARGELSTEERRQFAEHFLNSTEGRERVQFARTLAGAVSDAHQSEATQTPAYQPGFFASLWARGAARRFAAVAATVVLIGGVPWLLVERARMKGELEALRVEREKLSRTAAALQQRVADAERGRNNQLTTPLQAAQQQSTPSPIAQATNKDRSVAPRKAGGSPSKSTEATARNNYERRPTTELPTGASESFVLNPGNVRSINDGGNGNTFPVSRKTRVVMLKVIVDTDSSFPKYHAAIQTPEGGAVWKGSFAADPKANLSEGIQLPAVPAKKLPPGDYILELKGEHADGSVEPVQDYSFKVVKKPAQR